MSSKKLIDFNMNYYVYVKLNDLGRAELENQHLRFMRETPYIGDYTPPEEDDDGWSKWQFHDIMSKLGKMLVIGMNAPFETVIRFETQE